MNDVSVKLPNRYPVLNPEQYDNMTVMVID